MPHNTAFQQWLCMARTLDWSGVRRQQSALQAFALLQAAAARSHRASMPDGETSIGHPGPVTQRNAREAKR